MACAAEHLRLVERAVSDTMINLPPKGKSVEDLVTFQNPIYSAYNVTQVGNDQGYCIRVAVGKSSECFWTLVLKKGQIEEMGSHDELMAKDGFYARLFRMQASGYN